MQLTTIISTGVRIGVWIMLAWLFWRCGRIIYQKIKEVTRTKKDKEAQNKYIPAQPPSKPDQPDMKYTVAGELALRRAGFLS